MDEEEREALIYFLSSTPNAGTLIKGTGGVRKLRWFRNDAGKSGAYRVIYFFHSMRIPLFALSVFAKNEKINISQAEQNELKKLTGLLVEQFSKVGL